MACQRNQLLDSAQAWNILGNRWKTRAKSVPEPDSQHPAASEAKARTKSVPEIESLQQTYQKYMEMINIHVTLKSVDEKAEATWAAAANKPTADAAGNRRPSHSLFDFPLNSRRLEQDARPEAEHMDVLDREISEFSNAACEISDVSEASDDSSSRPHPAQTSSASTSGDSTVSKRKRDSVVPALPLPCKRHSRRARRNSKHTDNADEPCTCRRKSSLFLSSSSSSVAFSKKSDLD
eukprot:3932217-Rhodomonas_salina.1